MKNNRMDGNKLAMIGLAIVVMVIVSYLIINKIHKKEPFIKKQEPTNELKALTLDTEVYTGGMIVKNTLNAKNGINVVGSGIVKGNLTVSGSIDCNIYRGYVGAGNVPSIDFKTIDGSGGSVIKLINQGYTTGRSFTLDTKTGNLSMNGNLTCNNLTLPTTTMIEGPLQIKKDDTFCYIKPGKGGTVLNMTPYNSATTGFAINYNNPVTINSYFNHYFNENAYFTGNITLKNGIKPIQFQELTIPVQGDLTWEHNLVTTSWSSSDYVVKVCAYIMVYDVQEGGYGIRHSVYTDTAYSPGKWRVVVRGAWTLGYDKPRQVKVRLMIISRLFCS